ncbi:MAG: right-handed parallel beta-helix repeat-containing protein [bacterium]
MKTLILIKSAVCVVALMSVSLCLAAPDIYVNPVTGDDTNSGDDPLLPVKTITNALTKVDAGGTVTAAAGAYNESFTIDKAVLLKGANMGISPVHGARGPESVITAPAPVITLASTAEGAAIEGFEFSGSANDVDDGIVKASSGGGPNNVIVRGNIFNNNASRAINAVSTIGWLIADNNIKNITGTQESGLFLISLQNAAVSGNQITTTSYAGIIVDSAQNSAFTDNMISGVPQPGIQFANLVMPNTCSDNRFTQCNNSLTADKGAVTIYVNVENLTVTNNNFTDNYQAVAIRNQAGSVSPTVLVNNNDIAGNRGTAVNNSAQGGGTLDAANNWWGSNTGPTHASNPGGTGDKVSDNVNFTPWMTQSGVQEWTLY